MATARKRSKWSSFLIESSVVAAVAALWVVLLLQFLAQRPVNYREYSALLAGDLETSLRGHHIPPANIARQGEELRQNDAGEAAYWFFHRFTATVPHTVNLDALVALVESDMLEHNVQTTISGAEKAFRQLRFAFADHAFAEVDLRQEAPPPTDMRPETDALLSSIQDRLRSLRLTLPDPALPPRPLEDAVSLWTSMHLELQLPQPLTAALVRDDLELAFGAQGVAVTVQEDTPYRALVQLTYRDRKIAEIALLPAPPGTPPLPPLQELPLESTEQATAEPLMLPPSITLPPGEKPKVALILDDGGYGNGYTESILELTPKLTLAILPNTPFAAETARRAAALGFEIMLHMPMQTSLHGRPFPGQVNVGMSRDEIHRLTRDALSQIPFVEGVNNHTGSYFTKSAEGMEMVLEIVKEQNLYFIDSRTIGGSAAYRVSRDMGLRTGGRDIFIDNEKSHSSIRVMIRKLIDHAKKHGTAIGIGHFRTDTVIVLQQDLPKIQEEVEIVHASELVN